MGESDDAEDERTRKTPRRGAPEGHDKATMAGLVVAGETLGGRYHLVREVARGGMGIVFEAEDRKLDGLRVAIKVLPPELSGNEAAILRLKGEATSALRLSHPHVMRLHGFDQDGPHAFLVMEYLEGPTLELELARRGTIPLAEVLELAGQAAAGLQAAHDRQIVHRDVKPANLMFTTDAGRRVLKVTDFGIAAQLKDSMTRLTGMDHSGTLLYAAPEQLQGKTPKPAADQYALAAAVYELLRGRPPFQGKGLSEQILNASPEPVDGLAPEVWAALSRGLAKDPEARFATVTDFVAALGGKAANAPPTAPAAALAGTTLPDGVGSAPGTRRSPWSSGLGALVALTAIGVLGYVGNREGWFGPTVPLGVTRVSTSTSVIRSEAVPSEAPVPAPTMRVVPVVVPAADLEAARRSMERDGALDQRQAALAARERLAAARAFDRELPKLPAESESDRHWSSAEAQVSLDRFADSIVDFQRATAAAERALGAIGSLGKSRAAALAAERAWNGVVAQAKDTELATARAGRTRFEAAEAAVVRGEVEAADREYVYAQKKWSDARSTLVGRLQAEEDARQRQARDAAAREEERRKEEADATAQELERIRKEAAARAELARIQKEAAELAAEVDAKRRAEEEEAKRKAGETEVARKLQEREAERRAAEDELARRQREREAKLVAAGVAVPSRSASSLVVDRARPGEERENGLGMKLCWIPGGTFTMGSPPGEEGRFGDEGPQHSVVLRWGFWLGKYEVTQGEWTRVMGSNPAHFQGSAEDERRPVEQVSWNDAREFLMRLTELEKAAGRLPSGFVYRLPSEAEWEYAARAGMPAARYSGGLDATAWYEQNSGGKTQPVGRKQANGFGLHDMLGNVLEWCEDTKHESYEGAPTDGSAWIQGGAERFRVLRGGAWNNGSRLLRLASRGAQDLGMRHAGYGFRVVVTGRTR